MTTLPQAAYVAALARLPGAGPGWLAGLLRRHAPEEAWELVQSGQVRVAEGRGHRAKADGSTAVAGATDVAELWDGCCRKGIGVTWPGEPSYPSSLAGMPGEPGALFWVGDIAWVGRSPVVAIVGTRRCSPDGARTAYEMARDLATAGVCVVSGLALGIDGAAHAGALAGFSATSTGPSTGPPAAPTVGVAASGVDVVYPRQHTALWRQVAGTGAVVSETPPGMPAQSWRFPARNRVIAGLSRMVVVVESHSTGGSWHTVDAALRWGVDVGAVPGSVRSPACAGTNTMLRDGATPVRGAQDVLDALALMAAAARPPAPAAAAPPPPPAPPSLPAPSQPAPSAAASSPPPPPAPPRAQPLSYEADQTALGPLEERILAALSWRPACLEEVVERSGLPVGAAVVALDRLEASGTVTSEGGWWSRRT